MSITWRDGVTTLATAGVIVLERAYFHEWTWTIADSLRWTIAVVFGLIIASFIFSYAQDKARNGIWAFTAWFLGSLAIGLTALGLYFNNSDYLVLLMLTAVAFWLASIIRHVTIPSATAFTQMHT